jgi:hypothetical protein
VLFKHLLHLLFFFYVFEAGVGVGGYHGGISSLQLLQSDADGLEFANEGDWDKCYDAVMANTQGASFGNTNTGNDCSLTANGKVYKCDYTFDTGDSEIDGSCIPLDQRQTLLQQAQTAFLASIVVCQIGCGLAAKTRTNSLFTQGMVNNVQNYGIFQEVLLIVLLVYAPFLNYAFGTLPFAPEAWFLGAPFALLIWAYDECRKYHFRTYGKETWFYEWFFF